jgi:hypothetical protein
MGSIAAPRLGSIRIPDGFDPPDGSVPSRVSERTAWGRVGLGSSQDPPCHEGTIIPDGPSGPDQGNPAATVPRYHREMRGRLGTLPGAIPPAELSLVGWVRAQRINVNISWAHCQSWVPTQPTRLRLWIGQQSWPVDGPARSPPGMEWSGAIPFRGMA